MTFVINKGFATLSYFDLFLYIFFFCICLDISLVTGPFKIHPEAVGQCLKKLM